MKFFAAILRSKIFEPIQDVFWSLFQFFSSDFFAFGFGFRQIIDYSWALC